MNILSINKAKNMFYSINLYKIFIHTQKIFMSDL